MAIHSQVYMDMDHFLSKLEWTMIKIMQTKPNQTKRNSSIYRRRSASTRSLKFMNAFCWHIKCLCDVDLFISASDNYIHAHTHTHSCFLNSHGNWLARNIITDTLFALMLLLLLFFLLCFANKFLISTQHTETWCERFQIDMPLKIHIELGLWYNFFLFFLVLGWFFHSFYFM